jgi:hypothetical protein
MTLARQDYPSTALNLLFGHAEDATEALAREILSTGTGRNLVRALEIFPEATRKAAVREATTTAARLLDVDLIGVLVDGWREYRDITSAARHTLAAPDSSELVSLAKHQVTMTQEPYVDVLIDRKQVATIRLGLSLVFDVNALVAGIKVGRLVAIHTGHCDVTGTLAVQGRNVLTKPARIQLPGVIPLTPGVRLLPSSEYLAAEEHKSPSMPVPWWENTRPASPHGH